MMSDKVYDLLVLFVQARFDQIDKDNCLFGGMNFDRKYKEMHEEKNEC